jgi:phosphohistidine phosphatase SixA
MNLYLMRHGAANVSINAADDPWAENEIERSSTPKAAKRLRLLGSRGAKH